MNYFTCQIKDENIYESQSNKILGVTTLKYNSVVDELDEIIPVFKEYQKLLIDLGKEHGKKYINVPLSNEEVLAQIENSNAELSKQVAELREIVASLVKKEVTE